MTWHDMKEQRLKNRRNPGFRRGHHTRQGFAAIIEKKSGEPIAIARNGCFGRFLELDQELYQEWAEGTRGAGGPVPLAA